MSQAGRIVGRDPATGRGLAVEFADGKITAVMPAEVEDGAYLAPGFIDLQVNGYGGHDLNAGVPTQETIEQLARQLLLAGVTCFAPTLITASEASLVAALASIATARRVNPLLAQMIPFVHVEGPSIDPADGPRGAHPLEHVRAPDLAEFARWQEACDGLVGLVTLSPHFAGAPDYIRGLVAQGVVVSLGHTGASPEQVLAAVDAGARLSTHLGNGAASLLPRHPNFIWTQLADDRLTASFIADGHHLPAATLKAMLRAKSLDNSILVSDAAALGGMPKGRYESPIGGAVEVSEHGRLSVAGTPYLAGAGHLLNQNIAQVINATGIGLADAIRLATRNPGRFVNGRGVLEPGSRADLTRFFWEPDDAILGIADVYVAGQRGGAMMRAGAACVDITPPAGLHLAGFAARTEPATGIHDRLTARAVVVDDTALVALDVIGLHEDMAARIRQRCALPDNNVIVAATHTHGAPVSMLGRLGRDADSHFLRQIEDGAVAAIDQALANARPARLSAGMGGDPDVARNRRHADGPLDRSLPVVRIDDLDGQCIAVVVSYACHPVVLGADNREMTADYPHYVRTELEAAIPGAMALFLTGCTGDANTGHTAQASWTLAANNERTFATAERLGKRIAAAALQAVMQHVRGELGSGHRELDLKLVRLEPEPLSVLADSWRDERATAEPVRAILLGHWIEWAERNVHVVPGTWRARVSLLDWCGIPIVALPGEIFGETGLSVRAACGGRPALIISYAEGNPGYIPPSSEFVFGGYEVAEAHRFIGMPGAFAPGSAEALADAAKALLADRHLTTQPVA